MLVRRTDDVVSLEYHAWNPTRKSTSACIPRKFRIRYATKILVQNQRVLESPSLAVDHALGNSMSKMPCRLSGNPTYLILFCLARLLIKEVFGDAVFHVVHFVALLQGCRQNSRPRVSVGEEARNELHLKMSWRDASLSSVRISGFRIYPYPLFER